MVEVNKAIGYAGTCWEIVYFKIDFERPRSLGTEIHFAGRMPCWNLTWPVAESEMVVTNEALAGGMLQMPDVLFRYADASELM